MDTQTVTPATPADSATPTTTAAPATSMAPAATGMPADNSVPLTAKKSHNKQRLALIALAVVACAGVGFGIFGMVMSSQANQKSEALGTELAQKNDALKQVEEKLGAQIEIKEDAEEETDNEEEKEEAPDVNVSAAKNYIYIGEWGIKIKIPTGLISVSYVFSRAQYPESLYVSAVSTKSVQPQYVPSFLENSLRLGSGLGVISRYANHVAGDGIIADSIKVGSVAAMDDGYGLGEVVYIDDEYFYVYGHPNGLVGEESELKWEAESAEAIGEMFRTGISAF